MTPRSSLAEHLIRWPSPPLLFALLAGGMGTALTERPYTAITGAAAGLYLPAPSKSCGHGRRPSSCALDAISACAARVCLMIPSLRRLTSSSTSGCASPRFGRNHITRDTVPVNVDAIVFWMVEREKAILEVENYNDAITMSAQTALRESIGRHELHQALAEREMLGEELQKILDEKTNPWGITVQSVEIRDVQIPARCRMLCRARPRPTRAPSPRDLAQPKPKSPKSSPTATATYQTIPSRCICAP